MVIQYFYVAWFLWWACLLLWGAIAPLPTPPPLPMPLVHSIHSFIFVFQEWPNKLHYNQNGWQIPQDTSHT